MNYVKACIFSVVFLCANGLFAQKTITINTVQPSGTTFDYQAVQRIDMTTGFLATPASGKNLTARINEKINTETGNVSSNPSSILNRPSLNTNYNVGTTTGIASVGAGGQAFYEIPIFCSPGTGNLKPSISLQYISQQEAGVAGYGWDLKGLSAITRVPKNYYYDGQTDALTFTNSDAFSMDGQRLIVASGTNGANGAVYATEGESFVKISSFGTAGNGPLWFEVRSKNGTIVEYGNTSDSRLENGTTVIAWKINKISDANGNYMLFTYVKEAGESVIDKIAYTGNAAQGIQPYNSLDFFYDRKTDDVSKYLNGKQLTSSFLLRKIKCTNEGTLVKMYDFTYQKELYTKLIEVVESSGYGGQRYNSTLISWESDITGGTSPSTMPLRSVVGKGDANGDGIADLVVLDGTSLKLLLSSGLSITEHYICPYTYGSSYPPKVSLVNFEDGDNQDELYVRIVQGGVYKYVKYIYGSGTVAAGGSNAITALSFGINSIPNKDFLDIIPVEFNGDGKQEFAIVRTYNTNSYIEQVMTSTGINFYSLLPATAKTYTLKQRVSFLDFNGNGKTDIITIDTNSSNIYELSTAGSFVKTYSGNICTFDDKDMWGDFNGDGNTDLLRLKYSAGFFNAAYMYYSNGSNNFVNQNILSAINSKIASDLAGYTISVNDFNSDGKSDILFNSKNVAPTAMQIYYCNGKDFSFNNTITVTGAYDVKNWFFTDLNGDGKCDAYTTTNNGILSSGYTLFKYNASNTGGNVVTEIANGLNLVIKFDYVKLTEGRALTCYTATPYLFMSSNYGILNMPQIVVKNMYTFEAGLNENYNRIQYFYENAVYHKGGKGFLGFTNLTRYYSFNANHLYTEYDAFTYNTTYHVMYPTISSVWQPEGGLIYALYPSQYISRKTYSHVFQAMGGKRFWLKPASIVEEDLLNSLTQTTTYNTFDLYGNVTRTTVAKGSMSTVTDYTYTQAGSFCPNKISSTTVTMKKTGSPDIARATLFDYDAAGNLLSTYTDPATPKSVLTAYSYSSNQCGLASGKTISASGITTRSESYTYDAKFRFIKSHYNTLGQESKYTYDTRFGGVLTETSVDGNTSTNTYNGFGELVKNIDEYGTVNTYTKAWNTVPAYNNLYNVYTQKSGSPDTWVYYDLLSRVKQKKYVNPDGSKIMVDISYLSNGRLKGESIPYLSHLSPTGPATEVQYDLFGRTVKSFDLGREVAITYDATSRTTTTTIKGSGGIALQTSSQTLSDAGLVSQSTDNAGTITYQYNSAGQLLSVNSMGVTATNTYDQFGKQVTLTDPSSGTRTFGYNALGELISESANGVVKSIQYDVAGRTTQITEQPGNKITNFSYVSSGNGINRLLQATTSDAINRLHEYDSHGNVTKTTEAIEGTNLVTSYTYNTQGQLQSLTYPSGYKINYTYSASGYMSGVTNGLNQTIWSNGNYNVMGQPLTTNLANGLKFKFTYDSYYQPASRSINNSNLGLPNQPDPSIIRKYNYSIDPYTGSMNSRTDVVKNFMEVFQYDYLDRITQANPNSQPTPLLMTYHDNGNIKTKNDVSASEYEYNNTPYAVTDIPLPLTSIPSLQQDVVYNNNNLTQSITEGIYALTFKYGPDQERKKTVLSENGTTTTTRLYASNYEKETTPAGTKEFHYIITPSGLTAVVIRQNGTDNLYYTFTDNQGSVLSLLDVNGNVAQDYSYDAWGRRRNPANWQDPVIPAGPFMISRGYTGHEHIDQFGIINMNARMYDPIVGRVMSADNLVQSTSNTQSYNRYSYALNNPMKYTDPDGNFVFLGLPALFWAIAAFTATGSAMIMTGHTSSQAFNVALPVATSVLTLGLTSAVSTSTMGNTAALIMGSSTTSASSFIASGGKSDLSVNFGFGSYSFSRNEFDYLGKKGNSFMENVGFGIGAFLNVSDVYSVALGATESAELGSRNHSWIEKNGQRRFDPGMSLEDAKTAKDAGVDGAFMKKDLVTQYKSPNPPSKLDLLVERTQPINNINLEKLELYRAAKEIKGDFLLSNITGIGATNCSGWTSKALLSSGVFNIPIILGSLPGGLSAQMYIRQYGYLVGYLKN